MDIEVFTWDCRGDVLACNVRQDLCQGRLGTTLNFSHVVYTAIAVIVVHYAVTIVL